MLIGVVFLLSSILVNVPVGFAYESQGSSGSKDISNFYLISYDGGAHETTIDEDVNFSFNGWADETKSKVSGNVNNSNVTLEVTKEPKELKFSDGKIIYYQIIESDAFGIKKISEIEEKNLLAVDTTNGNSSMDDEKIVEMPNNENQFGNSMEQVGIEIEENFGKIDNVSKLLDSQSDKILKNNPVEEPLIQYSTHVQSKGWLNTVSKGISGTVGEGKRLEAIKIELKDSTYSGGVTYRTHVQKEGWQSFVSDGNISGTEGQAKRLEAIQIKLTGEIAVHYDVYYRVHAQTYGWLGWAKNGESAGTAGLGKRLEAIEIVLVKKNNSPPESTNQAFIANPTVNYSTHVQSKGWLNSVSNGEVSGTVGEGKRLEAIKINLDKSPYSGGIKYSTHVEKLGWLKEVNNGSLSGTTGEGKRLEAIKIELFGEMKDYYDIYYRVHAQSYGWLDWAKNGEAAGTSGLGKRLEAIQIVLVEKGGEVPGSTERPYITHPSIIYSTHVQQVGWLANVSDGATSGTVGEGKAIEAIKISLKNAPYSGDITYTTHIQSIGWTNIVSNGKISGTTGQGKRLEAIRINLTGDLAKYYDVYYRVHTQTFGWLDWAKNGQSAGTEGLSKRIEAVEIVLVEKGGKAPGTTKKPFLQVPSVVYSTHVQGVGWLEDVKDGKTSGNVGNNQRLEAVKITLDHPPFDGGVTYSAHIQSYGWMNEVSDGQISGTTKEGKRLEAIRINLTGEISKHYDIYYRVYVTPYGWLGWAKNGMRAGTVGLAKPVEAIEVKLYSKNTGPAVNESDAFIEAGIFISKRIYNVSFNDALNMQMKVNPQTDISPEAYVSKDYVDVYGSVTGDGINLRVSPSLSSSIYETVSFGTQFLILDDEVSGDSFEGSTKWYKILYKNKILYIHSKLAKIDYGITKVELNIREEPREDSYIFATVKSGSKLTILDVGDKWHKIKYFITTWRKASPQETAYYLNPNNFINDSVQKYQFLDISKSVDTSEQILNQYLKGKGVLEGKGKVFLEASKYGEGINVFYLVAHALLETGNGTSELATGVTYNGKTVYNMFGIGAFDRNPIENGAATAYKNGWFSVEEAIIGGAKWIYQNYLMTGKNTLYKMRWNPQSMETLKKASDQYATDIGWAYKQTINLYKFMDSIYQVRPFPIYLDVPVYK